MTPYREMKLMAEAAESNRLEVQSKLDRVTAERDALQQLLTAADERADVLEGLLRRAAAFTHDFENPISLRRDIDAALKPAEGGSYEA